MALKRKLFCRQDLIIVGAALVLAAAAFLFYSVTHSGAGQTVQITVDGRPVGSYSLAADREFEVPGYNGGHCYVVIASGTVQFLEATCPDKLCVHHSKISHAGESIICLPNRITAQIIGSVHDDGLDGVAQ